MSTLKSDTLTVVIAIAAIAVIIVVATLSGLNDTLVKLGIAAISGIAGFSFAGLVRRP